MGNICDFARSSQRAGKVIEMIGVFGCLIFGLGYPENSQSPKLQPMTETADIGR